MARLGDLGLDVRGLMTVAAPGEGAAKEAFETLGRLADRLGLEERSMGMSDDLEAAVAAGSTMVRIGRALFGAPPAGDRSVRWSLTGNLWWRPTLRLSRSVRVAGARARAARTCLGCRAGTTLSEDRRRNVTLVHEEDHGVPRPAR